MRSAINILTPPTLTACTECAEIFWLIGHPIPFLFLYLLRTTTAERPKVKGQHPTALSQCQNIYVYCSYGPSVNNIAQADDSVVHEDVDIMFVKCCAFSEQGVACRSIAHVILIYYTCGGGFSGTPLGSFSTH